MREPFVSVMVWTTVLSLTRTESSSVRCADSGAAYATAASIAQSIWISWDARPAHQANGDPIVVGCHGMYPYGWASARTRAVSVPCRMSRAIRQAT